MSLPNDKLLHRGITYTIVNETTDKWSCKADEMAYPVLIRKDESFLLSNDGILELYDYMAVNIEQGLKFIEECVGVPEITTLIIDGLVEAYLLIRDASATPGRETIKHERLEAYAKLYPYSKQKEE